MGKTESTTIALVLFMAGFALDDLHLFRAPMAYVGAAASILAFAILPPLRARAVLLRLAVDPPPNPEMALESALSRRRAMLGLTVVALVVWLVFFSAVRTPRW